MKDIVHSYFLLESDFEITFEKVQISAFENFILEECVEKHTLLVVKGLKIFKCEPTSNQQNGEKSKTNF